MPDISTPPDFRLDPDEYLSDESETGPTTNDLSQRRWGHEVLTPSEVVDYLRAAKGPEPAASAAKDVLAKSFHRLVLKGAESLHGMAEFDDLVAAGMLGLAEAIARFDPRRRNGLAAYAKHLIKRRMLEVVRHKTGWAGETRLERLISTTNSDATCEQAAKVMGRPVDERELEDARHLIAAKSRPLAEYDTQELGVDETYEGEERRLAFVATAPMSLPQLKLHAIHRRRGLQLESQIEEADRRAARRLKEIGRRAYALELVAQDRARIAARVEPSQYLYRTDESVASRARIVFGMGLSPPHSVPPTAPSTVTKRANQQKEKNHVPDAGRQPIVLSENSQEPLRGDDGRSRIQFLLKVRHREGGPHPHLDRARDDAGDAAGR
jgi:RNA polymerase sigma factor (sigma-70 family)